MRKYIAEFLGTFMLVFLGTGTVVVAKGGTLTIGLAFGLAITIMAYAVGGISGGNFNPGVTVAMMINKRLEVKDGIFYIIAQSLGSIVASAILYVYIHALKLPSDGFGQNDFSVISTAQAFGVELLATFLFVFIILMVTSVKYGNAMMAPLAIGLALAFLIIVTLNLTGGSLNAARSLGPALFAGGTALSHYWVYLIAPTLGAAIAAFVAKFMGSEEK
ncbi:MIP/aquaporin family protein [Enterococcus hermanniensis]|uniref:MIP family channel protein n=1 Tax=Enterococcus hermanniensis TaxID=249189 RepID=A0A1L8TPD1_9ENTE|nr:aquaporin [Enterococcus hermanniensis]OJG46028.1 MIP family channel protein [Enterococcus hermanniensis]